jgi:hypothetical protein
MLSPLVTKKIRTNSLITNSPGISLDDLLQRSPKKRGSDIIIEDLSPTSNPFRPTETTTMGYLHRRFPSSTILKSQGSSPVKSPVSRFKAKIAKLEQKLLPKEEVINRNKHINLSELILPNIVKVTERRKSSICVISTVESDDDFVIPVEKFKNKNLNMSSSKFVNNYKMTHSSVAFGKSFSSNNVVRKCVVKATQLVDQQHSKFISKCNELKTCLQDGYDNIDFIKYE